MNSPLMDLMFDRGSRPLGFYFDRTVHPNSQATKPFISGASWHYFKGCYGDLIPESGRSGSENVNAWINVSTLQKRPPASVTADSPNSPAQIEQTLKHLGLFG